MSDARKTLTIPASELLTDEEVLVALLADERAVLDSMREDWIVPMDNLAADTSVPVKRIRQIVRGFVERGWAQFGPAFDEDECVLRGSGYSLLSRGYRAQAILRTKEHTRD